MYFSGASGPVSFNAPRYQKRTAVTNFLSDGGVNPVDDNLPHEFCRIIGQQKLVVIADSFTWIVPLDNGFNQLNNGYQGSFDSSSNYAVTGVPVNCTIDLINPLIPPVSACTLTFLVQTVAPDSRDYEITLSPFPTVKPTITLVAGSPALGADDLEVKIVTYHFTIA